MKYYFAPLEGLTDSVYRRLHHKYFPGIDLYFTPFLSPTVHRQLSAREARELPPVDTVDFSVVPQILTKSSDDFVWLAQQCHARGYQQVNLNLGCPSGTVTAKGKGSAMLADLDALDTFLYEIFARTSIKISVKTRIGFHSAEEFPAILAVLNRYPICELTVHPRVRSAFYNGEVDMQAFSYAAENTKIPLCYNGDIRCLQDAHTIGQRFPNVNIMAGRGLIANPGMFCPNKTTAEKLQNFHDELLEEYLHLFGGSRNAMFRLKEHWFYLKDKFEGSEKLAKQLRKTTDLAQYRAITHEIFRTLPYK